MKQHIAYTSEEELDILTQQISNNLQKYGFSIQAEYDKPNIIVLVTPIYDWDEHIKLQQIVKNTLRDNGYGIKSYSVDEVNNIQEESYEAIHTIVLKENTKNEFASMKKRLTRR